MMWVDYISLVGGVTYIVLLFIIILSESNF